MPTLRGTGANYAQNGTDVVVTLPSGSGLDDLSLIHYNVAQDSYNLDLTILDPTSTYTEIAEVDSEGADGWGGFPTEGIQSATYYAILGSTPDTTVQVEGGGNADDGVNAQAQVWDGVETSNPLDVTPTTDSGQDPSSGSGPSITTVTDGCAIVSCLSAGHWNSAALTAPTGYTMDDVRAVNDAEDALAAIIHRTSNQTSAGAEDPGTYGGWSGDEAGDAWTSFTIAIRNEGASPGGGLPPGSLMLMGVGT